MTDWHECWITFADHVDGCRPCLRAGGLVAAEADLCPQGRALLFEWRARWNAYLRNLERASDAEPVSSPA